MSHENGNGKVGKEPLSRPGSRKPTRTEKERRAAADRIFRKLDLLAVKKLREILISPASTNMDLQQAIKTVFQHGERPSKTQQEILLDKAPPVLVVVQGGDGWPEAKTGDS
jgi:hypothetical protein